MIKSFKVLRASVKKIFVRNIAVGLNSKLVNVEKLKSWQEIPGPSSLPIIGQIHHFLPGGSLRKMKTTIQLELYNQYGPIARLDSILGRPAHIFLFDAECTAKILRGENWMPVRPGFYSLTYYRKYHNKTKEQSLKPTGLATEHGENWKQYRSTVNPVMLDPKTIKLYGTVLDEVAQDMIIRMKSIRNEDNMIKTKFDLEMNLWALESIGVVALGGRLNCFDPDLPENAPARKLIRYVHEIFGIFENFDFFRPRFWKYFPTPGFNKVMKLYDEWEKLTKYFINKAKEELKTKNKRSDDEKGILEKLLEINEEVANTMACDMLLAGVDTAANTMIAALYLLAMNPDKQNKLRQELFTNKESKRYLKACLREAMRILPVASGNIRLTTKEYSILGYSIPKGMHVVLCHQFLSTSECHYPKPFDYIPERWTGIDGDPLYHGNAHPFAFSPFGFGVRTCIGRRIAELEMETFLVRIIQNFHIEWTGPPPEIKQNTLNYIRGPFNFKFIDV